MLSINKRISIKLRWLVFAKRYLRALFDSVLPSKLSYAQFHEDLEIVNLLEGLDLTNGVYIDVGANQPSYISNTYLFYRRGLRGILIEPDETNFSLLRRFRSRDISIRALVGSVPKLCKFNYAIASVHNSIHALPASSFLKQEYVPLLTIDDIVQCIDPQWIYLLSTDTEGNDLEVLRGANHALTRTLLVCIEYNDEEERMRLESHMKKNFFELAFFNHVNLIFRNSCFDKTLLKVTLKR